MSEQLIIGISGLRGIIGENLTASIAADYGAAFGTYLKSLDKNKEKKACVCIGRDSRPSGDMLNCAVTAGLCAVGIDVIDLGIVPTPSVGIMVRNLSCLGGIVITASHNPIQYNGIKLLLGDGIAPPAQIAQVIKTNFLDKNFNFVDSRNCGKVKSNDTTNDIHVQKVLGIIDRNLIASKKFTVVLDSVNGAGGAITKILLSKLGCKVSFLNYEPTGIFAHPPEPTIANLTDLCKEVKAQKVDIGFAQDPDADRLAIVDEEGTYIGEEYTLALAAKLIFSQKKGAAAANLSTSRMIDDIAAKTSCTVYRTAVGEANVAEAMLKHNCVIGGEGNGGIIDLRVGPVRDSLVGIALILQLMAQSGKTVSQLVKEIGGYYMFKDKFTADAKQAAVIIDSAKKVFPHAKINTIDGCRFDFDDGWLHLRTSNTEPIMRFMVEAQNENVARTYIEKIDKIRKEVLG